MAEPSNSTRRVPPSWPTVDLLPFVATCRYCGALCLVIVTGGGAGWELVWDPDLRDRRIIRSFLTADEVAFQQFGYEFGGVHKCPAKAGGGDAS